MLRFKLEDLPPRLREQAERQLSPVKKVDRAERVESQKRVRPPITMTKRNEQSSAERRFNAEFLGGKGKFEALTLHLPGGSKYTPDFMVSDWSYYPDSMILVEVKGNYRLKSHARAATAFKTACACFPEFVFCWAELQKDGKSWKVSFFQDGSQLGDTEIITGKESSDCPSSLVLRPPVKNSFRLDTSFTEGA